MDWSKISKFSYPHLISFLYPHSHSGGKRFDCPRTPPCIPALETWPQAKGQENAKSSQEPLHFVLREQVLDLPLSQYHSQTYRGSMATQGTRIQNFPLYAYVCLSAMFPICHCTALPEDISPLLCRGVLIFFHPFYHSGDIYWMPSRFEAWFQGLGRLQWAT